MYFTNFTRSLLIAVLLITIIGNAQAQKFWLTTYEFPRGPKTGIIQLNDSNLLASYQFGILQSNDGGNHFKDILNVSALHCLFSTSLGNVYAGGQGKIFRSLNGGQSWDSVSLNTKYPIVRFTETTKGQLFAITGAADIEKGYAGDGVFFSDDQGKTWTQRNFGLNNYLSCEQITSDKDDKIYLTVADENISGNGGLFLSNDNGLTWQHIDIRIDGRNAISNEIKIFSTSGLTVTPDDSLIMSLSGVAANTYVQLNIKKKISAIADNSFWETFNITNTNSWWYDKLLGNIYFAKNGDRYSSVAGSINQGGTYFQKQGKNNWQRFDYGLGLDMNGVRNYQYFAENPTGRVFMIQRLDERIYWTDESITTISPPQPKSPELTIFPNPAQPGSMVSLLAGTDIVDNRLFVYNATGEVVLEINKKSPIITFTVPSNPGIYFVVARKQQKQLVSKLIVGSTYY